MATDYTKHIAFMDSLVNRHEWTEAERSSFYQAEPVRYWGIVVRTLGAVKPEQFFLENVEWTARVEKAMQIVESEKKLKESEQDQFAQLIKRIDDLEAALKAKTEEPKPEESKTEEKPADATPEA